MWASHQDGKGQVWSNVYGTNVQFFFLPCPHGEEKEGAVLRSLTASVPRDGWWYFNDTLESPVWGSIPRVSLEWFWVLRSCSFHCYRVEKPFSGLLADEAHLSESTDSRTCCKAWAKRVVQPVLLSILWGGTAELLGWPRWAGCQVPCVHLLLFKCQIIQLSQKDTSWL